MKIETQQGGTEQGESKSGDSAAALHLVPNAPLCDAIAASGLEPLCFAAARRGEHVDDEVPGAQAEHREHDRGVSEEQVIHLAAEEKQVASRRRSAEMTLRVRSRGPRKHLGSPRTP